MGVNVAIKKQQLEAEIKALERQEAEAAEAKRREENYKKFLQRPADWVIGRAHCDMRFKDNGWHNPAGEQLPSTVRVDGSCGHSYYPTAWVTEATGIFFHNVWSGPQRAAFQKKLNDLVQAEVAAIMSKPEQVLETMGLQSDHWLLKNQYPADKVESIKKEIQKEQWKLLDRYSDEELLAVGRLSHGEHILQGYLQAKRKRVMKKRKARNEVEF